MTKNIIISLAIGFGISLMAEGLNLHGWYKIKFIAGAILLATFLRPE